MRWQEQCINKNSFEIITSNTSRGCVIIYDAPSALSFLFNFPILNISQGRIKVDAHFHNWFATKRKALGIVLEVNLLQRRLGIPVQLQLYDIETDVCQQHDIYPSIGSVHFYIYHIARQEREDDKQHLLVMTFVVGDVAIWHRSQECLEQL